MRQAALTLRLRLLSSWNGRIQFCWRSHATASLSITADVTESFKPAIIVCIRRTMSGYLLVLSSWLRLNTLTLPSSNTWIYNHKRTNYYNDNHQNRNILPAASGLMQTVIWFSKNWTECCWHNSPSVFDWPFFWTYSRLVNEWVLWEGNSSKEQVVIWTTNIMAPTTEQANSWQKLSQTTWNESSTWRNSWSWLRWWLNKPIRDEQVHICCRCVW